MTACTQGMLIPLTPTNDEEAHHMVTHTPFQPWCLHCVAGRARGELHRRREVHDHPCVYEAGWTYCPTTTDPTDEIHESALCSLTVIHRPTGMTMATVVEREGLNQYSETMFAKFALMIAAVAFPNAVASRLRGHGYKVRVESTLRRSLRAQHQSIGGAERAHQTIGAFVRTLLHHVESKSKWRPTSPTNAVFMWMIRHASFLHAHHHVGADGLTAFARLTGRSDMRRMPCFDDSTLKCFSWPYHLDGAGVHCCVECETNGRVSSVER
eukprot:2948767-Amphidinium_carterae.2